MDPLVLALRVYTSLANLQVRWAAEPANTGWGVALPAAFYDGTLLQGEELLDFFQRRRDLAEVPLPAAVGFCTREGLDVKSDGILNQCAEPLICALSSGPLERAVDFILWDFEPCYRRFTRKALTGAAYVLAPLRPRRHEGQQRCGSLREALRELADALEAVVELSGLADLSRLKSEGVAEKPEQQHCHGRFACCTFCRHTLGPRLSIADVRVYSQLSVLLQIPREAAPWKAVRSHDVVSSKSSPQTEAALEVNPSGEEKQFSSAPAVVLEVAGLSKDDEADSALAEKLGKLLHWARDYVDLFDVHLASQAALNTLSEGEGKLPSLPVYCSNKTGHRGGGMRAASNPSGTLSACADASCQNPPNYRLVFLWTALAFGLVSVERFNMIGKLTSLFRKERSIS